MQSAESIADQLSEHHFAILRVIVERYPQGKTFAGGWLRDDCVRQRQRFRPGWMTKLANLGLLTKLGTTRGGNRQYYEVTDQLLVESVLSLQPTPV